jgi:hypothetical protein
MRLPLIAPAELSAEQRPVYADMRAGIEKHFQGFKTIADNGALMGPWNPWLHEPKIGKPIWDLTLALSVSPSLPRPVREVAICSPAQRFTLPMNSTLTSLPPNAADFLTTSLPPSSPASGRAINARF